MPNEIYDYSKDIKLNIQLSLNNKSRPHFFLSTLLDSLGLIGHKVDKYCDHLSCISANLILLLLNRRGEFVYYSRDNNNYKNIERYNPVKISIRKLREVIDLLIKCGFIDHRNGNYVKYSKELSYQSRIRPTVKFISFVKRYKIERAHLREHPSDVIVLKNPNKQLSDYVENQYIQKIRKDCLKYNTSLAHYKIQLKRNKTTNNYLSDNYIDFANKSYRRIFNNTFTSGGRFYGPWWLGVPSQLRKFITINDNETVEYDYSSLIIHQIYSEVGLNYFTENSYSQDPYTLNDIPESERKINKAIIQIGLNCKNLESLHKAIIAEFKKGNLQGAKPSKNEINRRLSIFKEMNPKISNYIYSNCALKFQFQDSEIARSIINMCCRNLIPVLSIHDSFIVEHTNSKFIKNAMSSAIQEFRLTSIPLIK